MGWRKREECPNHLQINAAGKMSDEKRNETQLLCDILGVESLVDEITPAASHAFRPSYIPSTTSTSVSATPSSTSERHATPSSILGPFHRPNAPIPPPPTPQSLSHPQPTPPSKPTSQTASSPSQRPHPKLHTRHSARRSQREIRAAGRHPT